MQIRIESGLLEIAEIGSSPERPSIDPLDPPDLVKPLPARTPYFDVGEATGKPGETVDIVVEAGCVHPMSGFHIGGGVGKTEEERSGYGKFKAVGAFLGPYLKRYLKDEGAIHDQPDHIHDHFFSTFQFMGWDNVGALPEEWWEFAVGLFSIDQARTLPPVPIPSGTHLFTLRIHIQSTTPPGVYELTCKDEWYYLNSRIRRRDFEYTYDPQGFTHIETFGGKITVTA